MIQHKKCVEGRNVPQKLLAHQAKTKLLALQILGPYIPDSIALTLQGYLINLELLAGFAKYI